MDCAHGSIFPGQSYVVNMKMHSAANKLTFLIVWSKVRLGVPEVKEQHQWIARADPFCGTPKW